MPLMSWLSPFQGKPDVVQTTNNINHVTSTKQEEIVSDDMDFESLTNGVNDLRKNYERALDMCEQANLQFDKYRTELYAMKRSLASERDANIKAHNLFRRAENVNEDLSKQIKSLQRRLKEETNLNAQLQARLDAETASLRTIAKHSRSQEEKLADVKLDLEYLKCTTNAEPYCETKANLANDAPIPPQPFVVVLVDGDAYKWSHDIGLNDIHLGTGIASNYVESNQPGAMAAARLRNEVTKYILAQNGSIPITAKIITRAFCNYASSPGLTQNWRKTGLRGVGLSEFGVQFTEKFPLFDFFDAGRGKERADDKIRESFHLYVSTPNCHAIFVAACLDNGFARMLEPYSDHPVARQKIVLISPGYVALEIQKLAMKEIQWPTVFAHRVPPPDMAAKYEQEKHKVKQLQRARLLRSVSTPAVGSVRTEASVLPELLDMVPEWNVNAAMGKTSRGVGFRFSQGRSAALESLDLADLAEVPEETDEVD